MESTNSLYLGKLLALMGVDPLEQGLQVILPNTPSFDPTLPVLFYCREAEAPYQHLTLYPPAHPAKLAEGTNPEAFLEAPLGQLFERLHGSKSWALFLPPLSTADCAASFGQLKAIVARLRSPGGCPWDREQTHDSLKGTLIEEAYEVLEALDSRDPAKLTEELGDLLMQVMIHTQIAEETGEFTITQVIEGISQKLIRRHPHVFGDVKANSSHEVMVNWEAIKRKERPHGRSSLANLPKHMPALAYAQSVQQRVARLGFDWQNVEGVVDKLAEEVRELVESQSNEEKLHETGDLLFALVNLARWLGIDAEDCLRIANERFIRRFSFIEEVCRQRGCQLSDLTFDEQDTLWELAKEKLL